jgi:hypothetical protein
MKVTMPGYNDIELVTLPDKGFWAYVVAVVHLGRKQTKAGKLHPDTHTAMKRILRHLRLQEVLLGWYRKSSTGQRYTPADTTYWRNEINVIVRVHNQARRTGHI